MAFIRVGTNSRLHPRAMTLDEAITRVQNWLDQPCVKLIQPTEQHWPIFQQMLRGGSATANLVTDAHLAALAVEHNCLLHSTDRDFARFRGLKWKNPLEQK
jgi:toxin-antitoxin system PIN domain toxin